jgi:hypothetical protein
MRPDSLAFSYRASAFKVYRKEKKKSDEFCLRNSGLEREFHLREVVSDPQRNPTRWKILNPL